jgi:hypothetical protein
MELARAPSSTQTMKLMSKYRNAQTSVGVCPALRNERTFMNLPQNIGDPFSRWPLGRAGVAHTDVRSCNRRRDIRAGQRPSG